MRTLSSFVCLGGVTIAILAAPPASASPCAKDQVACHTGGGVAVIFGANSGTFKNPVPHRPPLPRGDDVVRPKQGDQPVSAPPRPRTPLQTARGGGGIAAIADSTVSDVVTAPLAEDVCSKSDVVGTRSCVEAPTATPPAPSRPAAPAALADPVAPAPPPPPTYTAEEAAAQAWTTQTFTKPNVAIQPVGNTTLAGLPTYFQATFGAAGLAPGETVTTTVLGHTITIRPTNVRYTYHFGDGTSLGPTADAGGPYPSGKITHTYPRKGTVSTRIDITIAGQFQENGGAWQDIPGSTTVSGTPQQLTVAILQSRLHR